MHPAQEEPRGDDFAGGSTQYVGRRTRPIAEGAAPGGRAPPLGPFPSTPSLGTPLVGRTELEVGSNGDCGSKVLGATGKAAQQKKLVFADEFPIDQAVKQT